MKTLTPITQAEHRLYTLQSEWNSAIRIQQLIARDIAEHPEWGLEIGAGGPQLKTHQTPQISALERLNMIAQGKHPDTPAAFYRSN
jgi:hypothetical protein